MQAAEGRDAELKAALLTLAGQVAPLDGCEGVELMIDVQDPHLCMFVEHWASIDHHKAAGAALGKQAFAPVMALLAGPPEGCYLEQVAIRG
nr:antibiotic biosynthesis monooxygenase family protein [Sphingomonas sp. Root710]